MRFWQAAALIVCLICSVTTAEEAFDKEEDLWFRFVTRPDIQAPRFDVEVYDEKALSPGYWFVSPYEDADKMAQGQRWVGPCIYDGNGGLIWAGSPFMDHYKLWDFKVANVNGDYMLSGISQRDNAGFLINNNYELVKTIPWTPSWPTSNMHEFNVVRSGSRVLAATKEEHKKLSLEVSKSVGFNGHCEVTADGFVELDITGETPRTVFEWHGLDHLPLSESIMQPDEVEKRCTHNLDLYHINSIDKSAVSGDYLVSSRHTCTIYKVSRIDGSITWRLGGLQSDFKLPPEALFSRQHNARFIHENASHTTISLLDNSIGWLEHRTQDYSRGLVLALDHAQKTVEVIQEAKHPLGKHSESRGSNQVLPSGNMFLCWADRARLSEHNSNGTLLMHAVLRTHIDSYRAYKFKWMGQPNQPPDVYSAMFSTVDTTKVEKMVTYVFVSWNGDTQVARWRLYECDANGGQLKQLKDVPRHGFETEIKYLGGYARYVVVEALNHKGQPIGRSRVVQTTTSLDASLQDQDNEEWIPQALANPITLFAAGFIAAVVACAIAFLVIRVVGWQWWKPRDARYGPVSVEEPEMVFDRERATADSDGGSDTGLKDYADG